MNRLAVILLTLVLLIILVTILWDRLLLSWQPLTQAHVHPGSPLPWRPTVHAGRPPFARHETLSNPGHHQGASKGRPMSRRRFAIIVIAWVAAIGLCSTELGALVGFMAGMAVAMFGGAIGVALLQVASVLGFEMSWSQAGAVLLYGTLGLICVFVIVTAAQGLLRLLRGDERAALAAWAATLGLVAGPTAI